MPVQPLLSASSLDTARRFYKRFQSINVSEFSHHTPAQSINN